MSGTRNVQLPLDPPARSSTQSRRGGSERGRTLSINNSVLGIAIAGARAAGELVTLFGDIGFDGLPYVGSIFGMCVKIMKVVKDVDDNNKDWDHLAQYTTEALILFNSLGPGAKNRLKAVNAGILEEIENILSGILDRANARSTNGVVTRVLHHEIDHSDINMYHEVLNRFFTLLSHAKLDVLFDQVETQTHISLQTHHQLLQELEDIRTSLHGRNEIPEEHLESFDNGIWPALLGCKKGEKLNILLIDKDHYSERESVSTNGHAGGEPDMPLVFLVRRIHESGFLEAWGSGQYNYIVTDQISKDLSYLRCRVIKVEDVSNTAAVNDAVMAHLEVHILEAFRKSSRQARGPGSRLLPSSIPEEDPVQQTGVTSATGPETTGHDGTLPPVTESIPVLFDAPSSCPSVPRRNAPDLPDGDACTILPSHWHFDSHEGQNSVQRWGLANPTEPTGGASVLPDTSPAALSDSPTSLEEQHQDCPSQAGASVASGPATRTNAQQVRTAPLPAGLERKNTSSTSLEDVELPDHDAGVATNAVSDRQERSRAPGLAQEMIQDQAVEEPASEPSCPPLPQVLLEPAERLPILAATARLQEFVADIQEDPATPGYYTWDSGDAGVEPADAVAAPSRPLDETNDPTTSGGNSAAYKEVPPQSGGSGDNALPNEYPSSSITHPPSPILSVPPHDGEHTKPGSNRFEVRNPQMATPSQPLNQLNGVPATQGSSNAGGGTSSGPEMNNGGDPPPSYRSLNPSSESRPTRVPKADAAPESKSD